jgi:hypothetical protein
VLALNNLSSYLNLFFFERSGYLNLNVMVLLVLLMMHQENEVWYSRC